MKQVKYVPAHGSAEPAAVGGIELIPGKTTTVADDVAAMLFRSAMVVDAATGKNPNFICIDCGVDTNHDGVRDPIRARLGRGSTLVLVQEDGRRRCPACGLAAEHKAPVAASAPSGQAYTPYQAASVVDDE